MSSSATENLAINILRSATEYSIVGLDLAGTIIFWSEGAKRIYGYEAQEVVDRLDYSALHAPEDVRSGRPGEILRTVSHGGRWEGTLGRVRKGGERFTGHAVVTRRQNDAGQPIGFLLISHDVSGELEAEKRFRGLLEAAPDAIVIVDGDGRVVIVNSQTESLFGYSREQILGQPIEMLVPERLRSPHPSHRGRYFMEPRTRPMGAGLELLGLRADGVEFPVEISLSPLETKEGVLVTAAIRDVTERKRFQLALQDKNEELERAILAKDRFLASMSHELRTPLNAIIGFTGILLMRLPGPLTDDQETQLGIVRRSADHLLSLINDLLDLAKIDSGKVEVYRERVDPTQVVEEALRTLAPLAQAKNLRLSLETAGSLATIETDRRMLLQVLINLTNNAIKFTDQGSITLSIAESVCRGTPGILISITDTGIGISPEDQERLFEPFSQVRGREVREREGTGLGLHLSRKIVALLGGDITVESSVAAGSKFRLWLSLK